MRDALTNKQTSGLDAPTRRVRVMAMDEARLGLINWHKRRYRHRGERPAWMVRRQYEWSWLYSAVEPATGEDFCLYMSALDGRCFEVYLHYLAQAFSKDVIVLVLDNAPAHRWKDARIPENVILLPLPAYCPELNPVERFFLELRRALANVLFDSVEAMQDATTGVLERFWRDRAALQRLTGFGWWLDAVQEL